MFASKYLSNVVANVCVVYLLAQQSDTAARTHQFKQNQLDSLLFSLLLRIFISLAMTLSWWSWRSLSSQLPVYNDLTFAFTPILCTSHFNRLLLHGIRDGDNAYVLCVLLILIRRLTETQHWLFSGSLALCRTRLVKRLFLFVHQLNTHNSHRLTQLKHQLFAII